MSSARLQRRHAPVCVSVRACVRVCACAFLRSGLKCWWCCRWRKAVVLPGRWAPSVLRGLNLAPLHQEGKLERERKSERVRGAETGSLRFSAAVARGVKGGVEQGIIVSASPPIDARHQRFFFSPTQADNHHHSARIVPHQQAPVSGPRHVTRLRPPSRIVIASAFLLILSITQTRSA